MIPLRPPRGLSAAQMADPVAPKHYEFKIVLLGDRGVGKTCLVLRFIEGLYNAKQQSTIGAFFLTKKIVTARGDQCKIQIWDTAGQERFRAMAPMYYRNAAAAVVCFDVTDEQTFATMKDWVEELRTNVTDRNLVIAIARGDRAVFALRRPSRRRRPRADAATMVDRGLRRSELGRTRNGSRRRRGREPDSVRGRVAARPRAGRSADVSRSGAAQVHQGGPGPAAGVARARGAVRAIHRGRGPRHEREGELRRRGALRGRLGQCEHQTCAQATGPFAQVSERVIELRGDELCTTPAGRGPGGGPGGRGLGLGRDQSQSSAGCCKFS